ncbi:MAG: ABC transporter permease [Dehalococcoidia bacterium]
MTVGTAAAAQETPGRAVRIEWAQTFFALMQRDTRVLRREFVPFLMRTCMQPFLFVFVFAYVLPKIGQGQRSFGDILVPGLIGSSIIFQGIQAVAVPLVQEFSQTKEIEDRVMAPLPVWGVAAEKIFFAVLQSLLAAAVVFPLVYTVPLQTPHLHVRWWILFTVLPLGALVSASLGLFIGTVVNPRQIALVFSLIAIPVVFLGSVYYPWSQLHAIRWLQVLTLVNPLVYMSEGLRAGLTPQYGYMNLFGVYAGLLGGSALFTWLGVRGFVRRVVS